MLKEMFGSPKPKKAAPAAEKPAAPASAPVSQTVLGAGTQFEGSLRAEGHVRIDGSFVGDISTRGRILVGEQAKVDGDLVGEAVDIAGMVKGDIIARRVGVMRTGRVVGDLHLEKLSTEEGGFIQGLVRMEEKVNIADFLPGKTRQTEEPEAKAEPAPTEPEPELEPIKVSVPVKKGK